MKKEQRLLRIGVVGAGPSAQAAHCDRCRRARNAELCAICEVAQDLLAAAAAFRPLRADADTYKLQIEHFADALLRSAPQRGATIDDGIAAGRAVAAIGHAARTGEYVRLADVEGSI